MNPRTLLLCGKSLSRIWVGAGEDFCSREHRNQYRLRRGMDRLLEANKVASLARKRETPKLMLQTRQPADSYISRRAFLDAQAPPPREPEPFSVELNGVYEPRMEDRGDTWLTRRL